MTIRLAYEFVSGAAAAALAIATAKMIKANKAEAHIPINRIRRRQHFAVLSSQPVALILVIYSPTL